MDIFQKILLIAQPLVGSSIVTLLGGNLSKNSQQWYKNLKQSSLTPPPRVFPIAWTILYILLGLNIFFVYNKIKSYNRPSVYNSLFLRDYFVFYEIQLLLNFAWSFAFFYFKKPLISLFIIAIMIGLTIYLLIKAFSISKPAFYTLIPYIIWISFAMYLNWYVVVNN